MLAPIVAPLKVRGASEGLERQSTTTQVQMGLFDIDIALMVHSLPLLRTNAMQMYMVNRKFTVMSLNQVLDLGLLLTLPFAVYAIPLLRISLVVHVVSSELGSLLVFDLFWEYEVEEERQECSHCKASLHDQLNSVEEAEKGVVVARVRKLRTDVSELRFINLHRR